MTDHKTVYAQSGDMKSRTFLEYRRDMQHKAVIIKAGNIRIALTVTI